MRLINPNYCLHVIIALTPGNRLSWKPGCWLLGSHWVAWAGRSGRLLSHSAAKGWKVFWRINLDLDFFENQPWSRFFLKTNPGLDMGKSFCETTPGLDWAKSFLGTHPGLDLTKSFFWELALVYIRWKGFLGERHWSWLFVYLAAALFGVANWGCCCCWGCAAEAALEG